MATETYIPYSKIHNVTAPKFAQLYDYIEREIGWDFEVYTHNPFIQISFYNWVTINFHDDWKVSCYNWTKELYVATSNIFFNSYRTMMPLVRDEIKKLNQ